VQGAASLKFIARSGALEARMEESVSVRPAVAYRTQLTLGRFEGATTAVPLTRDLYVEKRKVEAACRQCRWSGGRRWSPGSTTILIPARNNC